MPGATLIAPADRLEPSANPDPRPTYTCRVCGHAGSVLAPEAVPADWAYAVDLPGRLPARR